MTSDEKTSLDQIVAGDEVAYYPYSGWYAKVLRREKVQRVTATWIILNSDVKFHKKNGHEVGAEPYRRDEIYPLGAKANRWNAPDTQKEYTYADLVEMEQAAEKDRQRRQKLAEWIKNRLRQSEYIPVEALEQAAALLGYEQPE